MRVACFLRALGLVIVVLIDVLGVRVRKVRDAPGSSVSLSEEDSSEIVFSVVSGAMDAAGADTLFDGRIDFSTSESALVRDVSDLVVSASGSKSDSGSSSLSTVDCAGLSVLAAGVVSL